jgi:hypothetical protein
MSAPPCPLSTLASVHGRPSVPDRSTNYPLGNNSLFRIFRKSCKGALGRLGNQPVVQILPILHLGPRVFLKLTCGPGFLQFSPEFEKESQKGP